MNIIDLAIKSIVVSILGLIVFAMTRRSAASTRHFALTLALFSLCALPMLIPVLPAWHVPFIKVTSPAPEAIAPKAQTNVVEPAPAAPTHELATPYQFDRDSSLTLLWASVATLLGLRVVTRLGRLRRLEKSLPMSSQPDLQAIVSDYCRRQGRHFLLLEGESNEPPMTWGHSRPVLLLPSVAREWPAERLRSVMLHELAHVERGDWIVSLASEIVCALFWFNPLVWVMRTRLELESELAADERVLSSGVPRTEYATHLVELLRDLNQFPKAADAAVAMTRPGRLDGRIKAILEAGRANRTARGSVTLGLVAVIASLLVVVGAAGPTLVHQRPVRVAAMEPPSVETPQSSAAQGPADDISVTTTPIPAPAVPSTDREKIQKVLRARPHKRAASASESGSIELSGMSSSNTTSGGRIAVQNGDGKDLVLQSGKGGLSKTGPDLTDDSENLIPVQEIQRQLKSASKDIQSAIAEANKEAAKAGVPIDFSGIVETALKATSEGLKSTKFTKKDLEAINAKAREEIHKAMKSIPTDKSDPDDN